MVANLQVGDLIAVRGRGMIARLIEWITKSKYSHVAVYVGDSNVIEAQGCRRVGYQRLSNYEGWYDAYRTAKTLTEAQQAAIVNYLVSQIGDRYDYFEIVILFIYYLLHLRLPYRETKRMICETLARNAYRAAGVDVPKADLSPGDLAACPAFERV